MQTMLKYFDQKLRISIQVQAPQTKPQNFPLFIQRLACYFGLNVPKFTKMQKSTTQGLNVFRQRSTWSACFTLLCPSASTTSKTAHLQKYLELY